MSERKKPGPKWVFDDKFGDGMRRNPLLPKDVWDVALHPENKITLNEMAQNPQLRDEIWSMGSEARKNRLLQEKKAKLAEEMQRLNAEEEKMKSKKPRQ